MSPRVSAGIFSSSMNSILTHLYHVQFCTRDVISIRILTLVSMADDMKLQQSLQESRVSNLPKTEPEDYFPSPPVSPEHPDPWSEQRWKDILSKEELTQHCSRCKEIGHGPLHCPYPIFYVNVSEDGVLKPVVWKPAKGIYRCSRCGRIGHNRRTCHGPVFY